MTKILIIGSNGNAGHMIHAYLKDAGYLVSSLARNNADYIVNIETKKDFLALKNIMSDFDYVINCAGVLVSASQDKPERAMLLNSFLPQYIASCLSATKTKLIHLSTDCVFSGTDHGGYAVTRLPDERQTYGDDYLTHYIIRSRPWYNNKNGHNLVFILLDSEQISMVVYIS